MIRVCLCGLGRTGFEVAKLFAKQKDMAIVAAICSNKSDKIGRDLGLLCGGVRNGVLIEPGVNAESVIEKARPNMVVDFSTPRAALVHAGIFARHGVNVVMGTTGFTPMMQKRLAVLARRGNWGIVYAPNITLGVNVMMALSGIASRLLPDYDFLISEAHHAKKADIPSGTAKKLANEVEKTLRSFKGSGGEVPINSVRAGGIVGNHELLAAGANDQVVIGHSSYSRAAFAMGALHAARFLHGKKGWFEMTDVLGIQKALESCLVSEKKKLSKRQNILKKNMDLVV